MMHSESWMNNYHHHANSLRRPMMPLIALNRTVYSVWQRLVLVLPNQENENFQH